MNPDLQRLQPYPFQKLAALFREVQPNPNYRAISLSIGEPKHATPQFIRDALTANLDGLANYPTTSGSDALRSTIARWLAKRYGIPALDSKTFMNSEVSSSPAAVWNASGRVIPTRMAAR